MSNADQERLAIDRTNVILYCRHWRDTVNFYRHKLRLPVAFENDWFVEFNLTADSFLSIADSRRATIRPVQGQGMTLTLRVADLKIAQAQLRRRDVETTPIRRKWDALVFYCHDPEGHRLEFWQAVGPLQPS